MPVEKTDNAYPKIAQLLAALDLQSPLVDRYIEHILQKEGNINFQISANTILGSVTPDLLGCTVLHLAYRRDKPNLFNLLLKNGADYTTKNQSGCTVLHEIVQDSYAKEAESIELKPISDNPFVTSILDELVKSEDSWNSCNEKGISHFHIACMANHKEAVEHFLKTEVLIDQAVLKESPIFPGYTAIHFAVRFSNLDIVKILLECDAAQDIKDAKGMTPIHILLQSNIEIAGLLNNNEVVNSENLISRRKINEDIIHLFLSKISEEILFIDDTYLTRLHVACIMQSSKIGEDQLVSQIYVDQAVNNKSSLFSGNTALHFAALCNIEKVKLLLNNGASICLTNAKKETAFGLCINRYEPKYIHDIISGEPDWRIVEVSLAGQTILDLIWCFQTSDFSPFLTKDGFIERTCVDGESSLWPTYSLLHVAVLFSERGCKNDIINIENILQKSSETSIHQTARRGICPLHLAFRMKKVKVVKALLTCNMGYSNLVDNDKLSYLHIACAAGIPTTVEKFLYSRFSGTDINAPIQASYEWYTYQNPMTENSEVPREVFIPKGSTPLHIAVIVGNYEMMELLMERDADLYATDEFGMTPIHWLIVSDNPIAPAADILFSTTEPISMWSSQDSSELATKSTALKECIASTGLTHLHVACFANDEAAVEQLLKDDNCKVNYRILSCNTEDDAKQFPGEVRYAGYTPLHFALDRKNGTIVSLLIEHGADVLMENPVKTSIPLFEAFNEKSSPCSNILISFFANNKVLQEELDDALGLTMLHFYCCTLNNKAAEGLLLKGRANDVNKYVDIDSPIWPGFTPLHVLMKFYQSSNQNADALLHFLLNFGADVMILNAEQNTPLHLAYDLNLETCSKATILKFLLRSQKNFSINPRNSRGLSHFHIACALNDVIAIKKFLESNVNVNQPVDFFYGDNELNGCTPLHLVLFHSLNENVESVIKFKAVTMLMQYGVYPNTENAIGNTALHLAAQYHSKHINLLTKIIDFGGDIHAKNNLAETPFEIILNLKDVTVPAVKLFLNRGYCANSFNPITQVGFVAATFSSHTCSTFEKQRPVFDFMVKACANVLDGMGRTVIHNVVSTSTPVFSRKFYLHVIESLVKIVDIDYQDKLGRTALHIATQFKNHRAVFALLQAGADINVLDANNETPFVYAFEPSALSETPHIDYDKIITIFSEYIQKLKICKLRVDEKNDALIVALNNSTNLVNQRFYSELEQMKLVELRHVRDDDNSSKTVITLWNVISGTNTEVECEGLSKLKHHLFNNLYVTIDKNRFSESFGIIRSQCRKFSKEAISRQLAFLFSDNF